MFANTLGTKEQAICGVRSNPTFLIDMDQSILTTLLSCLDLDHLAVDPRHQRRGIGKLLLNWGIEKAKHDGRDCYLVATPAGKSLYESVGFRTLQELSIFDVPHYSMILKSDPDEKI